MVPGVRLQMVCLPSLKERPLDFCLLTPQKYHVVVSHNPDSVATTVSDVANAHPAAVALRSDSSRELWQPEVGMPRRRRHSHSLSLLTQNYFISRFLRENYPK